MEALHTIEQVKSFIQKNKLTLLYASLDGCGVCDVIKPKVWQRFKDYEKLSLAAVTLQEIPRIAGDFSIFTGPTVLLFKNGKEIGRFAGYIDMERLERTVKQAC